MILDNLNARLGALFTNCTFHGASQIVSLSTIEPVRTDELCGLCSTRRGAWGYVRAQLGEGVVEDGRAGGACRR